MGYSLVVAAGILGLALVSSAYAVTTRYFEAQQDLAQARQLADQAQAAARSTAVAVTAVDVGNGTILVTARNTGSTTIAADAVQVLVDGVLTPVDARDVGGATTSVWPPLAELHLSLAHAAPTHVELVAPSGAAAYWGA